MRLNRNLRIFMGVLVISLVFMIALTPGAPQGEGSSNEPLIKLPFLHTEPPKIPASDYEAEGKVIYLTFDDGPGEYTAELLDTLAKYDAKATFFVTDSHPAYEDLIGRAYDEGHAIGIHSYSHNYYEIYDSVEAYKNDMQKMDAVIYEQTGMHTKLFRFPGGSSNTVSRSVCPGVMTELTQELQQEGFYYFDWNVLSGDAGETTDTSTVYYNVINGCSAENVSVVLMHDIKGFSVAAVDDILQWGVNNGYKFIALDESSFGAHHYVAN